MKILIMGGTQFVGRAITEALQSAGHEMTLFNRGQTGAHLFPEIRRIQGDRNSPADLARIRDAAPFDMVIDCAAYFPRQVKSLLEVMAQAGTDDYRYLFVSTASVYGTAEVPAGINEEAPRLDPLMDDPWNDPLISYNTVNFNELWSTMILVFETLTLESWSE